MQLAHTNTVSIGGAVFETEKTLAGAARLEVVRPGETDTETKRVLKKYVGVGLEGELLEGLLLEGHKPHQNIGGSERGRKEFTKKNENTRGREKGTKTYTKTTH